MRTVQLDGLPVIEGLNISGCTAKYKGDNEAQVTFTIEATDVLLALFKRMINKAEAYNSYKKWYPQDHTMVVLISCRGGGDMVQAARQFTAVVLDLIQAELEALAKTEAEKAKQSSHTEVLAGASHRGQSPRPIRQRHRIR